MLNSSLVLNSLKNLNGYILHQSRYLNDIFNKYNINSFSPTKNLIPIEDPKLKNVC